MLEISNLSLFACIRVPHNLFMYDLTKTCIDVSSCPVHLLFQRSSSIGKAISLTVHNFTIFSSDSFCITSFQSICAKIGLVYSLVTSPCRRFV